MSCNIAALGVPGSNGWRSYFVNEIEKLGVRDIYVAVHPDKGGKGMLAKATADLEHEGIDVFVLDLDGGDLCEFLLRFDTFEQRHHELMALIEQARGIERPEPEKSHDDGLYFKQANETEQEPQDRLHTMETPPRSRTSPRWRAGRIAARRCSPARSQPT